MILNTSEITSIPLCKILINPENASPKTVMPVDITVPPTDTTNVSKNETIDFKPLLA